MSIIIGADLVPTNSNMRYFIEGTTNELFDTELLTLLNNANCIICNLEVPLTDKTTPIEKCGSNLIAPENAVNGYKALGIKCVTLANNHIMDQGLNGLKHTIDVLDKSGIKHFGAGEDISIAEKPLVLYENGKRIGVYGCVEHEFSYAYNSCPGANPFDPLFSFEHVSKLKEDCDFVIVLYHGGKEHYRYPSPNLKSVCEKFIDSGADIVICQHSHCVGCEEKYDIGTIVYGQGNFLFDLKENEYWDTSILIEITDEFEIKYIPIRKINGIVTLADDTDSIIEGFHNRSKEILNNSFVSEQYLKFAKTNIEYYLSVMTGIKQGFLFRAINKLSNGKFKKWIIGRRLNRNNRIIIRNCIECEAHRELLLEGLKAYDAQEKTDC